MADRDEFGAFLVGFLVGAVAGGVTALLMAPQSGEETRTMIRDKSIELRDKAEAAAEHAEAWAIHATGKSADVEVAAAAAAPAAKPAAKSSSS